MKRLAKDQFDFLYAVFSGEKNGLGEETAREALERGWVEADGGGMQMTPLGMQMLEPYRVKRAIVMAAGFGSRLLPATANMPKPMIRVKGVRIIDTLLDAIVQAGIAEIYLVRGYKGECFDELLEKYPMIRFLENPYYEEANNISTVWIARDLIRDAYVCEADLVVANKALIRTYEYETNYLGAWMDEVDDWGLWPGEDGYVCRLSPVGGPNGYRMFGISFWTEEDGAVLSDCLDIQFRQKKRWQEYWDEVSMIDHLEKFQIGIRHCTFQDLVEIDTYEELQALEHDDSFTLVLTNSTTQQ